MLSCQVPISLMNSKLIAQTRVCIYVIWVESSPNWTLSVQTAFIWLGSTAHIWKKVGSLKKSLYGHLILGLEHLNTGCVSKLAHLAQPFPDPGINCCLQPLELRSRGCVAKANCWQMAPQPSPATQMCLSPCQGWISSSDHKLCASARCRTRWARHTVLC